ncbi:MAG: DUF2034 domain-containing protein [Anaerolineae bacterium]|nr:DUF2034 domain-containing protein [Anaerolineae bacterium]
MQFKDAAFEILKETGKPLHYNEITDIALKKGILETAGQTPHATMGALLYTDTLRDDSRFQREGKGIFTLKEEIPTGLEYHVKVANKKAKDEVHQLILKMDAVKFEELIEALLKVMGFEETETTPRTKDKGIDVKGVLKTNQLTPIKVMIQAKRWKNKVTSKEVQALRGSLSNSAEHGILITSKGFTKDAKVEAEDLNKIPITLIDGESFTNLLFDFKLGVMERNYTTHIIDRETWKNTFGVSFEEQVHPSSKKKLEFPIALEATHGGQVFIAELLGEDWNVRYNGKDHSTPSGAAKAVATNWKQVNGWRFWKYNDPKTGEWEYIDNLRNE